MVQYLVPNVITHSFLHWRWLVSLELPFPLLPRTRMIVIIPKTSSSFFTWVIRATGIATLSLAKATKTKSIITQVYFERLHWFAFIYRHGWHIRVVVGGGGSCIQTDGPLVKPISHPSNRMERWDNNLCVYFSTCPKITHQLRVACPRSCVRWTAWLPCRYSTPH